MGARLPFSEEGGLVAMLYQRVHEDAPPLESIVNVPLPLADVTMQALERNPADRFASAQEMGAKLAEAASEVWGPNWLNEADLPVMAASGMLSTTERGPAPRRSGTRQGAPPTARRSVTR